VLFISWSPKYARAEMEPGNECYGAKV